MVGPVIVILLNVCSYTINPDALNLVREASLSQ